MVKFDSFEEFRTAGMELFMRDPVKTRFSMKYRRCDQQIDLRLFDCVSCVTFRSKTKAEAAEIEKFIQVFMKWTVSDKDKISLTDPELEEALLQPEKKRRRKK